MTAGGHGTDLAGLVYLLTGASRGIGLAIATALVDSGARVVINGRDPDALRGAVAALGADRAAGVAGSVDEDDVLAECAATAVRVFGRLDGVVNNAGVNLFHGPLRDIPRRRFDRTIAINLAAPLFLVQHAIRHGLGANGRGAVLNMSSVGAQQPKAGIGAYCASKAGLEMLTKMLALELGPQGIRVNALAPGLVPTETSRPLLDGRADELAEARPLRRLGSVRDIADAAMFLLSDASAWTTGAVLVVDGGALLVSGPATVVASRQAPGVRP